MLRRISTAKTTINHHRLRHHHRFLSTNHSTNSTTSPDTLAPPPPSLPVLHRLRPTSISRLSRTSPLTLSATLISLMSLLAASYVILFDDDETINKHNNKQNKLVEQINHAIDRSKDSLTRIINTMKNAGVATTMLWKSLHSVLSSANHEVRFGFEVLGRVADLNVCEKVLGRDRAVTNLLRFIFFAQPNESRKVFLILSGC